MNRRDFNKLIPLAAAGVAVGGVPLTNSEVQDEYTLWELYQHLKKDWENDSLGPIDLHVIGDESLQIYGQSLNVITGEIMVLE